MLREGLCGLIHTFMGLMYSREARALIRTKDLRALQMKKLMHLLQENAETAFGKEHGFDRIHTVEDFRRQVPLRDYEGYLPWIQRIAAGEKNVLTAAEVLLLEPSSGSTSASKLIPYTKALKEEFQCGIRPWLHDLYTERRLFTAWNGVMTHLHSGIDRLFGRSRKPVEAEGKSRLHGMKWGRAYWSVTPAAAKRSMTDGGVPIGFEEDKEYFGTLERYLLDAVFAVPGEVVKADTMDAFYRRTCTALLACRDLTLISVWNPTYLMLLLKYMVDNAGALAEDLRSGSRSGGVFKHGLDRLHGLDPTYRLDQSHGAARRAGTNRQSRADRRADEVVQALGKWDFHRLWPQLKVISCWCDAQAAPHSERLKQMFPDVTIQPKGLLATEGFVSFPLQEAGGAVLSAHSHFFEFEAMQDGRVLLADELQIGGKYAVILTTAGGLVRYRLKDVIQVTGFYRKLPMMIFLGKQDKVSDLFGEKLNELFVREVLEKELSGTSRFAMLAPEEDRYVLYVGGGGGNGRTGADSASRRAWMEGNVCRASDSMGTHGDTPPECMKPVSSKPLAVRIDNALRQNFHYDYCRNLGQLKPLRVFRLTGDPEREYLEECVRRGQRVGDIKPALLHLQGSWDQAFTGRYEESGTNPEDESGTGQS